MDHLLAVAPLALASIGAVLGVLAFGLVVLAGRRRARAFEVEVDRLGDEIWELREASAARERAEAANEAKTRFLANVSHEVRTPLNGILGMAELLTGTPLDAEQKTYVAAIRSSGSALASLIEEILDFSKIEAGKVEIAAESFDVVALVEGVAELLAPRAQGKSLEIASTAATNVPRKVVGDPARLRQILLNLAGNAIKFTQEGGVGLRVNRGPGDTRCALRWADTGPGIAAARRAAIFEEFEQADPAQLEGGTGLGLAISKRLAERMGGALALAPGEGGGTTFVVTLPLAADPLADAEPVPAPQLAACLALVVADSPFEAPFLVERLGEAGRQGRACRRCGRGRPPPGRDALRSRRHRLRAGRDRDARPRRRRARRRRRADAGVVLALRTARLRAALDARLRRVAGQAGAPAQPASRWPARDR